MAFGFWVGSAVDGNKMAFQQCKRTHLLGQAKFLPIFDLRSKIGLVTKVTARI